MRQASRVSQRTAFFHLGVLVEGGALPTRCSPRPTKNARKTTSLAASASRGNYEELK